MPVGSTNEYRKLPFFLFQGLLMRRVILPLRDLWHDKPRYISHPIVAQLKTITSRTAAVP